MQCFFMPTTTTDQTARMCRMIGAFIGCTSPKVCFLRCGIFDTWPDVVFIVAYLNKTLMTKLTSCPPKHSCKVLTKWIKNGSMELCCNCYKHGTQQRWMTLNNIAKRQRSNEQKKNLKNQFTCLFIYLFILIRIIAKGMSTYVQDFRCWCFRTAFHYENMPVQIYRKISPPITENFQIKNSESFRISAQNIDCGYSLEPPRFGEAVLTSTHNICFWAEIRKIMYTPVNPSFTI